MDLFIVRHGIAGDRLAWRGRDADRPLTPKGVERTRAVAEGLHALGCRPDRIGTSPLLRASQTADLMAEVLGPDVPVEVCSFLGMGASAREVAAWLRGLDDETVMIVGHMPGVAEIASGLLCRGASLPIVFRKAAVCCLAFDGRPGPGRARLEWLLQPRHLRGLAAR